MKKIIVFLLIVLLTGCMGNTPTKVVEEYFNKYQMLDKSVLNDLDNVIDNDITINEKEKKGYRDFMKKHYQDLKYEIKNETIDGDDAIVEVAITVRDYANTISKIENYKSENAIESFSAYRLDELKKVNDEVTYTINVTLVKQNGKWIMNQLNNEELNKINGLYAG